MAELQSAGFQLHGGAVALRDGGIEPEFQRLGFLRELQQHHPRFQGDRDDAAVVAFPFDPHRLVIEPFDRAESAGAAGSAIAAGCHSIPSITGSAS